MKIVSWNCGGKFREKFQDIIVVDADIYVIQECENPAECKSIAYIEFAHNYLWIGENKNKGLGVFAKNDIQLRENNWQKYCLRNFLSVRVNDLFNLVAVWACKPYIEEYYIYQREESSAQRYVRQGLQCNAWSWNTISAIMDIHLSQQQI